jgi:hypothetical protein
VDNKIPVVLQTCGSAGVAVRTRAPQGTVPRGGEEDEVAVALHAQPVLSRWARERLTGVHDLPNPQSVPADWWRLHRSQRGREYLRREQPHANRRAIADDDGRREKLVDEASRYEDVSDETALPSRRVRPIHVVFDQVPDIGTLDVLATLLAKNINVFAWKTFPMTDVLVDEPARTFAVVFIG